MVGDESADLGPIDLGGLRGLQVFTDQNDLHALRQYEVPFRTSEQGENAVENIVEIVGTLGDDRGSSREEPAQFVADDRERPLGAYESFFDESEAATGEQRVLEHQELGIEKVGVGLAGLVGQTGPKVGKLRARVAERGLEAVSLGARRRSFETPKGDLPDRSSKDEGLSQNAPGGNGKAREPHGFVASPKPAATSAVSALSVSLSSFPSALT